MTKDRSGWAERAFAVAVVLGGLAIAVLLAAVSLSRAASA